MGGTVALSEQEQRMLREIEQSLLADDPKFSAAVKNAGAFAGESRTGGLTLRGIALFMLGLVLLVGGVALSQQNLWFVTISVVGFLLMFGAAMWMLQGGARRQSIERRQRFLRQTPADSNSSVASRMEDNFRRRFDEH